MNKILKSLTSAAAVEITVQAVNWKVVEIVTAVDVIFVVAGATDGLLLLLQYL